MKNSFDNNSSLQYSASKNEDSFNLNPTMQRSGASAANDSWFSPVPVGMQRSGTSAQAANDSWFSPAPAGTSGIFSESPIQQMDEYVFTNQAQIIVEELRVINKEIQSTNDKQAIQQSLIDYISIANDETQALNLKDQKEQDSALKIMQLAIVQLESCQKYNLSEELYQELYYDTYNNMARISNFKGDIKSSLVFLKMALSHVQNWWKNPNMVQDVIQVTKVPELYMNICNAELYLDLYDEAIPHADGAITQSEFCQVLLQQAMKGKSDSRLETLLESQIHINVTAVEAKGQCYEQMRQYEQAKMMYEIARNIAERNVGKESQVYREVEKKVRKLNTKVQASKKVQFTKIQQEAESIQVKPEREDDLDFANKSVMMSSILKREANEENDDTLLDDSSIFQNTQNRGSFHNKGRKLKTKKKRKLSKTAEKPRIHYITPGRSRSRSQHSRHSISRHSRNSRNSNRSIGSQGWGTRSMTHLTDKWEGIFPQYSDLSGVHPHRCGCCRHGPRIHKIPGSLQALVDPTPPWKKKEKKVVQTLRVVSKPQPQFRIKTNRNKVVDKQQVLVQQQIQDLQNDLKSNQNFEQIQMLLKPIDEQQNTMLLAMEKEKERLMHQRMINEQEEMRLRQEILRARARGGGNMIKRHHHHHKCQDWRCQNCNPPPPSDTEMGHPVYDPLFKCWTYPYAAYEKMETQPDSPPQSQAVPEKINTCEIEVQADFPRPKIEKILGPSIITQTEQTHKESEVQTVKPVETAAQIKPPPRSHKYTPEQASIMIQRIYRRLILFQRMVIYRQLKGILLSRKYSYNKASGAMEILSIHMIINYVDLTCMYLQITIFDYVTRKFIYFGKYESLDHVGEFNGQVLYRLVWASLQQLEFERPPFRNHITIIQSIINANVEEKLPMIEIRMPEDESSSSSSSSSEYSSEEEQKLPQPVPEIKIDPAPVSVVVIEQPARPQTPPPIYIERQGPPMISCETYMDSILIPKKVPKPPKTYMHGVIFIQLYWKWFLAWKYFKIQMMRSNKQIVHSHQISVDSHNCGKKRYYQVEIIKIFKHFGDCAITNYRIIRGFEGVRDEYCFNLIAHEKKCTFRLHNCGAVRTQFAITDYQNLKLPGENDQIMRSQFISKALRIVAENCLVERLYLERLIFSFAEYARIIMINNVYNEVVPYPISYRAPEEIGLHKRYEFKMFCSVDKKNECVVIVYRRIRWYDSTQLRKFKDWVIEVKLIQHQRESEYLILFKLPCKKVELQNYFQQNLKVYFKDSLNLIDYLELTIYQKPDIISAVSSIMKTYHDLSSKFEDYVQLVYQNIKGWNKIYSQSYFNSTTNFFLFKWEHIDNYYLSQLPDGLRVPKDYPPHGHLYDIHLESHEPLVEVTRVYEPDASKRHHGAKIAKQMRQKEAESSSESEDEEEEPMDKKWAWDFMALAMCQMDEQFNKKKSKKLTCVSTTDIENHKIIVVDPEAVKWPNLDCMYQYLAKQFVINLNNEKIMSISFGDALDSMYDSDQSLGNYFKAKKIQEVFMAQDTQQVNNQDYVCTVFAIGNEFLVEAIRIRKPIERAYLKMETLAGMRGVMLFNYLDEELELVFPPKKRGSKEEPVIQGLKFNMEPEEYKKLWLADQIPKEQEIKIVQKKAIKPQQQQQSNSGSDQSIIKVVPILQKWARGAIARRRLNSQLGQSKIVSKFHLTGDLSQIFIIIQKYATYFLVIVFNMENKVKRNDIQYLKMAQLPGDLNTAVGASIEKMQAVFSSYLNIQWWDANARPRIIKGAAVKQQQQVVIQRPVQEVKVVQQVVEEVRVEKKSKKDKKDKKKKKKKKKKESSSSYSSSSASPSSSSSDGEASSIKEDIKQIKSFVKKIQKKIASLDGGIRPWFDIFDKDRSDQIELVEFLKMLEYLSLFVDQRLVVMLFKLFDRSDRGYFSFSEFEEIIDERMMPNYKKIVIRERERWKMKEFSGESQAILQRQTNAGHAMGAQQVILGGGQYGGAHGQVVMGGGHQVFMGGGAMMGGGQHVVMGQMHGGGQQVIMGDLHHGGAHQVVMGGAHGDVHQVVMSDAHHGGGQQVMMGGSHQVMIGGGHSGGHQVVMEGAHGGGHQVVLGGGHSGGHQVIMEGAHAGGHQVVMEGAHGGGHQVVMGGAHQQIAGGAHVEGGHLIVSDTHHLGSQQQMTGGVHGSGTHGGQSQTVYSQGGGQQISTGAHFIASGSEGHQLIAGGGGVMTQSDGSQIQMTGGQEMQIQLGGQQLAQYNFIMSDFIKPLKAIIKQKKISTDAIFKTFDKDKSFLLSAKEIAAMIKVYLNYQCTELDEMVLTQSLKKTTGRSDLKKAEFSQLIDAQLDPVHFKPRIAIHVLSQLQIDAYFFEPYLIDQSEPKMVALPAFKMALYSLGQFDQEKINNLASFVDKNEDGLIEVQHFIAEMNKNKK